MSYILNVEFKEILKIFLHNFRRISWALKFVVKIVAQIILIINDMNENHCIHEHITKIN
jgi:hypothetical protein